MNFRSKSCTNPVYAWLLFIVFYAIYMLIWLAASWCCKLVLQAGAYNYILMIRVLSRCPGLRLKIYPYLLIRSATGGVLCKPRKWEAGLVLGKRRGKKKTDLRRSLLLQLKCPTRWEEKGYGWALDLRLPSSLHPRLKQSGFVSIFLTALALRHPFADAMYVLLMGAGTS